MISSFPSTTGQLPFTSGFTPIARLLFRRTPMLATLITKGLMGEFPPETQVKPAL
jgi:hypothetical protein